MPKYIHNISAHLKRATAARFEKSGDQAEVPVIPLKPWRHLCTSVRPLFLWPASVASACSLSPARPAELCGCRTHKPAD